MSQHDVIQSLQQAISNGSKELFDVVPCVLRRVIEDRLWEQRRDRNGELFRTFESFVTHILWEGLESSINDLLLYSRRFLDVQALIHAEVLAAAEHGPTQHTAGVRDANFPHSDTATYKLSRLKQNHPDLGERVVKGELSAAAAVMETGIQKRTTIVPDVQALIRAEMPIIATQLRNENDTFDRSNDVTVGRGNSPTYVLRRLQRDHPALAERVMKGELSANAAAIEAGFRKRTIRVPDDADAAIDALVGRFGIERVRAALARKT